MNRVSTPAAAQPPAKTPRGRRGRPRSYLKVVFSPGVAPDKWFTRFDQRTPGWAIASARLDHPLSAVEAGSADVAIARLPVAGVSKEEHHMVRLYEEAIGVAASTDHPIAVMREVTLEDVEQEVVLYRTPVEGEVEPAAVRSALAIVSTGAGIAIAPRPLLRGLNYRGVAHCDVGGDTQAAGIPGTQVALVWRTDRDDEVIQQFVGICRGRREGSSR
ncbi:hypothetical protein CWC39_08435 [Corynebacterium heidelbergense]|uniref:LysR substrate-binding domain-containing protein n=1 Tax=Corynebacterium heidelbergense TaxID=2055947 RepID=A0A364V9X4_9CORY|nr:hypothetical protein CWC39_08435 [Corynebacterium heidelbergense]